jgi:hypothetical protein
VRAEGYAEAAVNADKGLTCGIKINRINGTGFRACTAVIAELYFNKNAAAFSLGVRAGRAGGNAGRRVAGKAGFCFKAR